MTAVEWLIDRLEVNKFIPSPYPGEFWNLLKEEAKAREMQQKREMKQKIEDPIVLKVMAKYYERSQLGINKYGTTLAREDLELTDWLTHAQDEAMDLSLYIERIKQELESMKQELKDIKEEIVSSKTQSVVVKYEIK